MLKVFNPQGTDEKVERQIWYGNSTGIINLNNVRHKWAIELYEQMRSNFWIPEKLDLSTDVVNYNELTTPERRAYNGILSYLVFLDSVQVQNLPHLIRPCSSPEVNLCFAEQLSQEGMHGKSYQYMIESIIPPEEREQVYSYWREDPILFDRCQLIGDYYQQYIDKPTRENHIIALIADYILEGLYFYVGFIFFYNLASRNLMSGSADIFKLINRDELSHVRLYQKILIDQFQNSDMEEKQTIMYFLPEMMKVSVEQEIKWSRHIIGDNILGMPPQAIEDYIKYLANLRLKAIGFPPIFLNVKNTFKHLEKLADTGKEATTKTNFFDSTVTSYQMSTTVEGWNDI
jgi:ribonucleoside-diphosphate reductase beta chain